jgi:hypothetical protein
MTTEVILLLVAVVLVILSVVSNALDTFNDAGTRLGARVEKQLSTGKGFPDQWVKPAQ